MGAVCVSTEDGKNIGDSGETSEDIKMVGIPGVTVMMFYTSIVFDWLTEVWISIGWFTRNRC